jgi:pimeloyl-ACP methyl ester carboxylesterase
VTADAIILPDGRRLRWREFGDPAGSPVIYTAGTPVSGLAGAAYDESARAVGLRWISPDKPGYGDSDYHRERTLVSWGDDLARLASHLGLDQFALAGESGGGPFTLAAAHQLSRRVDVVALIASSGAQRPGRADRAGQQARIRFYGWLARNVPPLNAIPFTKMKWALATPAKRDRVLQRVLATEPQASPADLRIELEAVYDALRPGTRGVVQEAAMIKRPWPFPLGEVKSPVHLWHGARDTNAPIANSLHLARELPDTTLHLSDTSDHDIGHERSDEITAVIASCVRS